MDKEKLKLCNELAKKIEDMEIDRERWERAVGVDNICLIHKQENKVFLLLYDEEFEVLKTLMLRRLDNKISSLKEQFENL